MIKSFGTILREHLAQGTRPNGVFTKWTVTEFAYACGGKTRNAAAFWIRDEHFPPNLAVVEIALFGMACVGEDPRYTEWRRELAAAYDRAKKGDEPAKTVIISQHEPSSPEEKDAAKLTLQNNLGTADGLARADLRKKFPPAPFLHRYNDSLIELSVSQRDYLYVAAEQFKNGVANNRRLIAQSISLIKSRRSILGDNGIYLSLYNIDAFPESGGIVYGLEDRMSWEHPPSDECIQGIDQKPPLRVSCDIGLPAILFVLLYIKKHFIPDMIIAHNYITTDQQVSGAEENNTDLLFGSVSGYALSGIYSGFQFCRNFTGIIPLHSEHPRLLSSGQSLESVIFPHRTSAHEEALIQKIVNGRSIEETDVSSIEAEIAKLEDNEGVFMWEPWATHYGAKFGLKVSENKSDAPAYIAMFCNNILLARNKRCVASFCEILLHSWATLRYNVDIIIDLIIENPSVIEMYQSRRPPIREN